MKIDCAMIGPSLFSELNVLENITLPLMIRGISRAERNAEGEELLRELGLSYIAHCYPNSLSDRERQAVVRGMEIIMERHTEKEDRRETE